jgi:hypothetical protein
MQKFSNGFYLVIAAVAVLWSLLSTDNKKQLPETHAKHNQTRIEFVDYSNEMPTPNENRRMLRSINKLTIKSESKVRRNGGTGTAFYIGNNLWITARHVINECPQVYMVNETTKYKINQIYLHPNSDLAIFKHETGPEIPYFRRTAEINNSFSSGFPAGKPGDISMRYLGVVALENKQYGIFEKGLIFNIIDRNPYHLDSIGGLSGGPAFTADNLLAGVLVAENARRAIAIVVDMNSVNSLISKIENSFLEGNEQSHLSYNFNRNNYAKNGKKMRSRGTIRKIYCIL